MGASAGLWYAGGVDPVGRRRALTGVATPGQALRAHPLGLLLTAWPWRCLAYLVATPVVAATWLLTCGALLPLAGLPLARVERWRLRWVDHHPVADPHTPAPAPGLAAWLRHRLQERATWTELLYGVLLLPLSLLGFGVLTLALLVPAVLVAASGLLLGFLLVGVDPASVDPAAGPGQESPATQVGFLLFGLVLLAAGLYLVTLVAEGQRYLARLLITEPGAALAAQVAGLARSRQRLTTAFDQERRRIERDLHDGVQQRLTTLAAILGTLRYHHQRGGDVTALIDQASAHTQQAIAELRDIVHGIYPAALREHDLAGALDDLAGRAETGGLQVTVDLDLPDRLPAEVAAGLYFAVSELFTNVLKHAQARRVLLSARTLPEGRVRVTVQDDGKGGARRDRPGLLGVADRIEALGGQVRVSSPAGGPTRITLEVPCAS